MKTLKKNLTTHDKKDAREQEWRIGDMRWASTASRKTRKGALDFSIAHINIDQQE